MIRIFFFDNYDLLLEEYRSSNLLGCTGEFTFAVVGSSFIGRTIPVSSSFRNFSICLPVDVSYTFNGDNPSAELLSIFDCSFIIFPVLFTFLSFNLLLTLFSESATFVEFIRFRLNVVVINDFNVLLLLSFLPGGCAI